MIPIDIGPRLGVAFGSSTELERVREIHSLNFKNFKQFYSKNPEVYHNDTIFPSMINLIREYTRRKVGIRRMLPNISMHLDLVYRNAPQVLHDTHLGKLLLIPVFDNSSDLLQVIYSDATDLNYVRSSVIESTSFVTINMKLLQSVIADYDKRGKGNNRLITEQITIPLYGAITDWALYNRIVDIESATKMEKVNHPFRIVDLNNYLYESKTNIRNAIYKLDTNPLDVLHNIPLESPLEYTPIEDEYIDNLLWINLLTYKAIVSNGEKVNREKMYEKFHKSYRLYRPRGRSDSYFTSCSSELLDKLEDINFI